MYTILASYTTHTQHVYSWYWYFTIDDGTVTRDACLNTHTCKLTLWGLHSWTSLHSVHGVTEPGEGTCTQLVFSRYLLTVAIDQWRIQRGSMGSMEPLFGRAAFENTTLKRTTHVSTPVSRIRRAHGLYVHVYATRSTWQPSRQWAKRASELKFIHALLRLQLGVAIRYQYESAYFPVPYADNQLLCNLCGPKWSHAFYSVSRSSNFCNFTLRIHRKRSQKVLGGGGHAPSPTSKCPTCTFLYIYIYIYI